jgi:cytochrome c
MKPTAAAVVAALCLAAGGAQAQSGEKVVAARGCNDCHGSASRVGPAYKDIAAKHRDDKRAEARLVSKLKEGKAHLKVDAPDAELKAAIQYVLKQ